MRVALISDLHANEPALEAVLRDTRVQGVDQVVCLGDVATLGPRPDEILARLRDLGCVCILGNHDEFLFDEALIHNHTEAPVIIDSVDWCRSRVSAADLDFVRGFHRTWELPLEGETSLFLFHGSARSNMEDLLATTPPELVDEMLAGRRAAVLAGGHTHVQMLRQHRGRPRPTIFQHPRGRIVSGATWLYASDYPARSRVRGVLQHRWHHPDPVPERRHRR